MRSSVGTHDRQPVAMAPHPTNLSCMKSLRRFDLSAELRRGTFRLIHPSSTSHVPPKHTKPAAANPPINSFLAALNAAGPRPAATAERTPKKNYAEKLS